MMRALANKTVATVLGWLHQLRLFFSETDLRPDSLIRRLENDASNMEFEASGDNASFRVGQIVPAGWWMAEVTLKLQQSSTEARFSADFGHAERNHGFYRLPLRSGRIAKRILHFPSSCHLRFHPVSQPGCFELKHFRLVRLPARMARNRILKKLGLNDVTSWKNVRAGWPSQATDLWLPYNALFESVVSGGSTYERWMRVIEPQFIPTLEAQSRAISAWDSKPVISILLPTWNTPERMLRECLDSVLDQSYPHWQLCIADDGSTVSHVRQVLLEYAGNEPRIRLVFRNENGHIAHASNSALEMAEGDFVALLDHDDVLAPHALFAVVQAIQRVPRALILYSDEDKLDTDGNRCAPFFKPGWSPDLLLSQNYLCHLCILRHDLVKAVGGFRPGFEGSQDYDLLLRCIRQIDKPEQRIVHVPQILYHWRQGPGSTASGQDQKSYAADAGRRALQEYLDHVATGTSVEVMEPGIYRVRRTIPDPAPMVSLIIPSRDGYRMLRSCIDSIISRTTYRNYELIIVDNQSTCARTLAYLEDLQNGSVPRARVIRYDAPFNFSAINNLAARHARGQVLGLINNDIEVIDPGWLTEMVSHAIRPEIGCVGTKLSFPDGSLQHAGVVLGIGGVAGHPYKYLPGNSEGYFGRLRTVHNVSAVTGAALLVRKAVFEAVGGLDAGELPVAFNDVDFCIKVQRAGYRNLWTPHAQLVHHESKTRGPEDTPEKKARFKRECDVMRRRWGRLLLEDPYYNPNLTLADESYGIALTPRRSAFADREEIHA